MSGSIDLSSSTELEPLAEVVRDVLSAAALVEAEVFVAGAVARDLWLQFAFGISTGRRTEDLDFAMQCPSWEVFHSLSVKLVASGFQIPEPLRPHRFLHANGTSIDLVPFGGLERADRTIVARQPEASLSTRRRWRPSHGSVLGRPPSAPAG